METALWDGNMGILSWEMTDGIHGRFCTRLAKIPRLINETAERELRKDSLSVCCLPTCLSINQLINQSIMPCTNVSSLASSTK